MDLKILAIALVLLLLLIFTGMMAYCPFPLVIHCKLLLQSPRIWDLELLVVQNSLGTSYSQFLISLLQLVDSQFHSIRIILLILMKHSLRVLYCGMLPIALETQSYYDQILSMRNDLFSLTIPTFFPYPSSNFLHSNSQ